MWRILLLVGMQTGTVTAKNSMEVSQKKKKKLKELPYNPAILLLGTYPKKPEALI